MERLSTRRLTLVVAAVAVAIGLYRCSGGSGDQAPVPEAKERDPSGGDDSGRARILPRLPSSYGVEPGQEPDQAGSPDDELRPMEGYELFERDPEALQTIEAGLAGSAGDGLLDCVRDLASRRALRAYDVVRLHVAVDVEASAGIGRVARVLDVQIPFEYDQAMKQCAIDQVAAAKFPSPTDFEYTVALPLIVKGPEFEVVTANQAEP
jgi:hypothetical protein